MSAEDDQEPVGWSAIEAAMQEFRPGVEALRIGVTDAPETGGIVGLNVFREGGLWLLISLGLTELFQKVTDDPAFSGWGFEFTLRVPDDGAGETPPGWAIDLLCKLGAYVFGSGSPFGPGHRMDPGGPITGARGTRLTALAFAPDPELDGIDTPNGRVEFLTVVGITKDELARMKATSTREVLDAFVLDSPLLVTDPKR